MKSNSWLITKFRQNLAIGFGLVLLIVLGTWLFVSSYQVDTATTKVYFAPTTTVVAAETVFTLPIYIDSQVPIENLTLVLNLATTTVELLSIEKADSVIQQWSDSPKVVADQVILTGESYDRGFRGRHLVATLNLRAKQAGVITTGFSSLTANSGQENEFQLTIDQPVAIGIEPTI